MENFLPNTDNFFKYLLTIGLLLIAFAIVYPVERQKEVDLERLTYNEGAEVLNLKIENLQRNVEALRSEQGIVQHILDSLKALQVNASPPEISRIEQIRTSTKESFDLTKKEYETLADSLVSNTIHLDAQKAKVSKLNSYYSFFRTYKIALLILGLLLSLVGLRYWLASVYMDEVKKAQNITPTYQSSFIRHIEYCKRNFVNTWTVIFFILLVVAFIIIIMLTN